MAGGEEFRGCSGAGKAAQAMALLEPDNQRAVGQPGDRFRICQTAALERFSVRPEDRPEPRVG